MIKKLITLVFICSFSFGCGKDEEKKDVIDLGTQEQEVEISKEEVAEDLGIDEIDKFGEETESVQVLDDYPEVAKITIESITDDMRGGFRAVVKPKVKGQEEQNTPEVDYIYQWKKNDVEITGETDEELGWQDDFKKGDKISVEVIPFTDEAEGIWKAEGSFIIPNLPPIILSDSETSLQNGEFRYVIKAEDPDGDAIEYTLTNAPAGMILEPASGVIIWKVGKKDTGEYKVNIIVSDSEGAKVLQELTITIPEQTEEG